MRIRVVASCAVITCAGAMSASAASCVSSNNPSGPGVDASFSEDSAQPPIPEAGGDVSTPPADAGRDATDSSASLDATDSSPGIDAADAAPAPDAADAAPPGCAPQSITGFVVPPYLPASPPFYGHCLYRTGVIANAVTDCFDDASTPATCAGFAEAGDDGGLVPAQCASCLFTPEGSDAGYAGAIASVVSVPNVAGCVQLLDSTDAGYECAEAIQAAWECAEYACKTSCPVIDAPSRAAYLSCTSLAATGVCSSYAQAAQTCIADEEADSGSPTAVQLDCFDGTTAVLDYFCGS